jgi:hypothetical protein
MSSVVKQKTVITYFENRQKLAEGLLSNNNFISVHNFENYIIVCKINTLFEDQFIKSTIYTLIGFVIFWIFIEPYTVGSALKK